MTDPQPKRSRGNPEKRQGRDAGLSIDLHAARLELATRARALGFGELGVASVAIPEDEQHLLRWLEAGFHGEMSYMQRHGVMRSRPDEFVPGTVRVISVRMDYWPQDPRDALEVLDDGALAYVSRYALGRDYHKIMRRQSRRNQGHGPASPARVWPRVGQSIADQS